MPRERISLTSRATGLEEVKSLLPIKTMEAIAEFESRLAEDAELVRALVRYRTIFVSLLNQFFTLRGCFLSIFAFPCMNRSLL